MSKLPFPFPRGEYAVGTATFTVYNHREETMYCAAGGSRHVPARVWYPADKASVEGLPRARYMSEAMTKALAKTFFLPIRYQSIERDGRNRSECYEGAPFIEGRKFPLILFNHGYLSFREGNSFLCIELASRGYVVISVGHPHEALRTEFDDGTGVGGAKHVAARLYSPPLKAIAALLRFLKKSGTNEELAAEFDALQKRYCRYSIERIPEWKKDTLAALGYAKEHYSQLIDFSCGVAAAGHSMGGAAAYALCEDEPEFVCGVNIDGALFGEHGGKTLPTPFLQMNCETNRPSAARAFLRHRQPVYHAVIRDMQHLGFSDMKHFISMKAQMGGLDPNVAHETVSGILGEFFDAYLKKTKAKPAFEGFGAAEIKEYAPDV